MDAVEGNPGGGAVSPWDFDVLANDGFQHFDGCDVVDAKNFYRDTLRAYMARVIACEGADYIDGMDYGDAPLTEKQTAFLTKLAEDIRK
jgi:hypothetical protein